jgi:hypothetical protein
LIPKKGADVPLAPRYYAFAVTRLLVLAVTIVAMFVFWACAGNPAVGEHMLGFTTGLQVSDFDLVHIIAGLGVIGLCGAFAWMCIGRMASAILLIGMILVGVYVMYSLAPTPIPPAATMTAVAGGLTVVSIVISLLLPGPKRDPTQPWA